MKKRLLTLMLAMSASLLLVAYAAQADSKSSEPTAKAAEKTSGNESTDQKDSAQPLNEAIGDDVPDDVKKHHEEIMKQVSQNPAVTDAMRPVLQQHGISEDSVSATPGETAKAAVSKDEAGKDSKKQDTTVLGLDISSIFEPFSNLLGKPAEAAPNCPTSGNTSVAIFNDGSGIYDSDLQSIAGAIDNQLWNQYSAYYSPCAYAYYASSVTGIGSGSEVMYVQAGNGTGAQGGHTFGNGAPYASPYGYFKVYWPTQSWNYVTRSISHEVLEMLANPYPDYGAYDAHTGAVSASYVGGPSNDWVSVQKEIGDPMGQDGDYTVRNWWSGGDGRYWTLANFALPNWFVPGSAGPWDYNRKASSALSPYGSNAIILYYYPWSSAGNGSYKYCKSFVDPQYYCVSSGQRVWF